MKTKRNMAVADSFYPNSCLGVETMIASFNHRLERIKRQIQPRNEGTPRAFIVPHAGWVYSGYTANTAYRHLKQTPARRIIICGPSHRVYFKGISAAYYASFATPCGDLAIDTAYQTALARRFQIGFIPQVHAQEHSTEVQAPFIKHYRPDAKIIELIYGDISPKMLANLFAAVLKDTNNFLIVSSDLSHYYPLQKARRFDSYCQKGVRDFDLKALQHCEACGKDGIVALVLAARHLKLIPELLDYRTSADYRGKTDSVVGYMSAVFYQN